MSLAEQVTCYFIIIEKDWKNYQWIDDIEQQRNG